MAKRKKGYCISCGDDIATWAFSAAVSSKKIDIGVETNPKISAAGIREDSCEKKMVQYTIEQSKKPVWACHYKNDASAKMAEKLGFVKMSECSVIKKKKMKKIMQQNLMGEDMNVGMRKPKQNRKWVK